MWGQTRQAATVFRNYFLNGVGQGRGQQAGGDPRHRCVQRRSRSSEYLVSSIRPAATTPKAARANVQSAWKPVSWTRSRTLAILLGIEKKACFVSFQLRPNCTL